MDRHHAVFIKDRVEARAFLEEIGASESGIGYMIPKSVFRCIKLVNISAPAANIIKQEMLSKGGEAAVSKSAVKLEDTTDILLLGTLKQYDLLCKKLRLQPFGLKAVAEEIEQILKSLEPEKYTMQLANGRSLEIGQRTLIMGILNVTPDSFSDGGRYFDPDKAVEHALQMCEDGADIIDLGGVSSRPGTGLDGEEEELKRILPVLKRLSQEKISISVDTFRSRVAQIALDNGAHLINDIGGLELDPQLIEVLVSWQAPVVIMHNRFISDGSQIFNPDQVQLQACEPYHNIISDIIDELQKAMKKALAAGLAEDRIIIDPGLGFGKTPAENRLIIKRLEDFTSLGKPILVGASRKGFIGQTLSLPIEDRLEGNLAIETIAIMNGADIIRVHDVKESKRVALMTNAVQKENG